MHSGRVRLCIGHLVRPTKPVAASRALHRQGQVHGPSRWRETRLLHCLLLTDPRVVTSSLPICRWVNSFQKTC